MHEVFPAIFFDLDGTLIDSEVLWIESYLTYMKKTWFIGVESKAAEKRVYGKSCRDIHAQTKRSHPGIDPDPVEMEREMRSHFHALKTSTDMCISTSVGLLKRLSKDHQIAIVSGSPRKDIAFAMDLMDVRSEVSFYLGAEDYSRGKPDPEPYLKAATRLGLTSAQCLVFEDSYAGVSSAKEAGMTCVALKTQKSPCTRSQPSRSHPRRFGNVFL